MHMPTLRGAAPVAHDTARMAFGRPDGHPAWEAGRIGPESIVPVRGPRRTDEMVKLSHARAVPDADSVRQGR